MAAIFLSSVVSPAGPCLSCNVQRPLWSPTLTHPHGSVDHAMPLRMPTPPRPRRGGKIVVRGALKRCFAEGNGVAVRSLGRQGAAGAMRFLLAMREEGAAAADELRSFVRDVCIRLVPQEPLKPFGTPLLLIVTAVRGRTQLPPENSPQCVPLSVASRTDSPRLETKVLRELNNLQPGQFLRLDMVGTDALYRGLSALRDAQERIPAASYNFFAVPELVSVPVRARREPSQLQQQQQQQGSPRQEQAGQGQKQQQQEANAGQQQPVAGASIPGVDPERPGKGKVLVSEAELQELKGALGSMMEQQKMLDCGRPQMGDRSSLQRAVHAPSPLSGFTDAAHICAELVTSRTEDLWMWYGEDFPTARGFLVGPDVLLMLAVEIWPALDLAVRCTRGVFFFYFFFFAVFYQEGRAGTSGMRGGVKEGLLDNGDLAPCLHDCRRGLMQGRKVPEKKLSLAVITSMAAALNVWMDVDAQRQKPDLKVVGGGLEATQLSESLLCIVRSAFAGTGIRPVLTIAVESHTLCRPAH
ncbi:hypothetical protein VOLCADRAFT_105250 [Volvox carteri f. nagariensis]|uniref:Uncharacterized protein n=1 Tax=Volvox carteri f. nagariensis TaxID=3068 RepID=D8TZL2_VOLCA|nr:uncharacterized protein VOLCADRAFT_105250 [Volvox carteri f. nagariensis]EFJ46945.1 hypothetical protein VOLCADRAFT_105250 [Volvox carteri f. nagariensis]|eukprot:XP_002951840.1 hypothetical protein VOLCADRAFT_105250 [Volvox carteri f. nagariensis]